MTDCKSCRNKCPHTLMDIITCVTDEIRLECLLDGAQLPNGTGGYYKRDFSRDETDTIRGVLCAVEEKAKRRIHDD